MALNNEDQRRLIDFETAEKSRAAWRIKLKTHGIMAVAGLSGLGVISMEGIIPKIACLVIGMSVVAGMAVKEPNDKES